MKLTYEVLPKNKINDKAILAISDGSRQIYFYISEECSLKLNDVVIPIIYNDGLVNEIIEGFTSTYEDPGQAVMFHPDGSNDTIVW